MRTQPPPPPPRSRPLASKSPSAVFQAHAIDASGQVVVRQQLKRARVIPFFTKLAPCTVGIEACASSHHWARELTALGHTVKLMPPAYV